jgi:hypothetical protein
MEHLQFDDVSHDPNTVESPIQPTRDWDWGFVRESLGKQPVTDEDSPDSVLSRLWKMQQKLASKRNFTSDDSVDHQREASSESSPQASLQEDSKLANMENPGSRNETRKSTEKIDAALPSTVVEGAVPLIPRYDEVERAQRQTVEDRQKMLVQITQKRSQVSTTLRKLCSLKDGIKKRRPCISKRWREEKKY